jgi:hypothetical protein
MTSYDGRGPILAIERIRDTGKLAKVLDFNLPIYFV